MFINTVIFCLFAKRKKTKNLQQILCIQLTTAQKFPEASHQGATELC